MGRLNAEGLGNQLGTVTRVPSSLAPSPGIHPPVHARVGVNEPGRDRVTADLWPNADPGHRRPLKRTDFAAIFFFRYACIALRTDRPPLVDSYSPFFGLRSLGRGLQVMRDGDTVGSEIGAI